MVLPYLGKNLPFPVSPFFKIFTASFSSFGAPLFNPLKFHRVLHCCSSCLGTGNTLYPEDWVLTDRQLLY
ncbi:hypothetical protein C0J52_16357 [Blattella germanica]|nr:hypothetical protein C0J52_16357 [Blattella germanica]